MSETKEALDRFKAAMEAEKDNRERALEAVKFRDLEQWPDEVKNAREKDEEGARPCLTVDKVNQYIKQVCNDQRQNRPQISVRPVDDNADIETAKVYNGIIRHIESNSRADIAYDRAFEHAADGGFGYFRFLTDYCDPMSFEQDIIIKSIRNRFSVYLDPEKQEPDASDMEWGFITERMNKSDYKKKHKGSEEEWKEAGIGDQKEIWYTEHYVRIAEYFFFDNKKAKLLLLEDGSTILEKSYLSEQNEKDFDPNAWKPDLGSGWIRKSVTRERDTTIPRVRWQKISGQRVLDEKEWAGIYIPIVQVVGNEIDIEGEVKLSGMVRPAMDAQRMYNYSVSAYVEMVALAPKSPYVAADGQIEDYEKEWRDANRRNISVLPYTPTTVDGALVPAPQRQPMPGIPAGWAQSRMIFDDDIQGNMGMYKGPSLGAPSNEKSGRAIMAKQRESDTSNFNYVDNLTRSMIHGGKIMLDLIPRIYDTKRAARILGEDNSVSIAYLNPEQSESYIERPGQNGKKKSYNLSVGKYDVTVTVGPAYSTRREESANAMVQVTQAYPALMQFAGDILFRNLDWPGADEVAERLKKLLPPELQEDEEDDRIAQLTQALQQAHQQVQMMGMQMEQLANDKSTEAAIKEREVSVKEYDAETKRIDVIMDKVESAVQRITNVEQALKMGEQKLQ